MGNTNVEKVDDKQAEYIWRQNRKHPSLGMITIAKEKGQKQSSNNYSTLKVIEIVDKSQKQIKMYASKLDRRIQLSKRQETSKHIIKVLSYRTKQETFNSEFMTCGNNRSTHRVQIKIEDLDKTLSDVSIEHKAKVRRLQLRQIAQILKSIIDRLVFMYDYHIAGVIPSFETVVRTTSGQYKLIDSEIMNQSDQQKLYKSIFRTKIANIENSAANQQKVRFYLAPQLLETLNAKMPLKQETFDYISYHKTPKSDIFSLAAVFLELYTQKNFGLCYLWQFLVIQQHKVAQMLAQFKQKLFVSSYKDQIIIRILQKMLKFDEHQRIGLSQLQNQIQEYMKIPQILAWDLFKLPKINRFHTDFQLRHSQSQRYQRPCLSPTTPHQETNNVTRKFNHIKHFHQSSQNFENQQTTLKLRNATMSSSAQKCYEVTSINSSRAKYPRLKAHIFSNGARYQGQINQENEFQGKGILYYPDMTVCYEGKWKKNKFHGLGTLYSLKQDDSLSQRQQIKTINHTNFNDQNLQKYWRSYQGQFKQDQKSGIGLVHLSNGDRFQGIFENNLLAGLGTYFYSNGNKFEGIWQKDHLLVDKNSPFKKKKQPFHE